MARPWDNTLYVESHYPASSLLPKCPECFDLWVPMAHRGVVLSFATATVPPPATVATAAVRLPWSPTPLVFAFPIAVDKLSWTPAAGNVPPSAVRE